jgi:tetratricopeptide (TPR) repeat protein
MSPADVEQRTPVRAGGRRVWLRPWLPAVVGALCFANIIFFGKSFVYDDAYIIRDNPRLHHLTDFRAIWLSDWWHPQGEQAALPNPNRDRLYRPLTLFTYAVSYAVGGLWPPGFHLVNVALHALVCVLVWHFAQRLFGDAALSTWAALLFAVHPVHCEAVANTVGRAEILCALFLLAGLLILLPPAGTPGVRRAILAGVAFFAALLAKETAVCYPALALLVLHAVIRTRARPKSRWWLMHTAILLLPLIVYLPLRYVSLEQRLLRTPATAGLFNPLRLADSSGRTLGPFTILGHYTRLMIVPSQLSCDYGTAIVDPQAGPDAMTLLGGLTAAGGLLALVGYRRQAHSTWRRIAVATALIAASYALISNTVLLIGVSLAERLMYWPSVPILILAATAVMWVWRNPCAAGRALHRVAGLLRVCGILLIVVLGLRAVLRNFAWTSNAELFFTDVATHPEGAHLNKAAARELIQWSTRIKDEYERRRILAQAEQHLIQALEIYPCYPEALRARGRVRALLGDVDGAIRYFEIALQLAPRDQVSKEYLARLHGEARAKEARLTELLRQVEQHPDDPTLRKETGELLIELARPDEALEHLEHAVQLAPQDAAALRLLGQVLILHHQGGRATEVYEKVLALSPNDWEAHINLTPLMKGRDPAAALQHARQAHRLRPDDLRSNVNLAEALAANQLYEQALERYYLIRRGFPENHPYRAVIRERIDELERLRR